MMVPLVQASETALVRAALYNISQFDQTAFQHWLRGQPPSICTTAAKRRPDALYRLGQDWAVIIGYRQDGDCVVQVLGRPAEHCIIARPADLEDVTDTARADLGLK